MAGTKYYLDYDGLRTLVSSVQGYYDTWRDKIRGYLDEYNTSTLSNPYMLCAELGSITPSYVKITKGTAYSGTAANLLGAYVLEQLTTSQRITSTANLFSGCSNLYWCDLSNLTMSKVTTTEDMFSSCSNLVILRISGLACSLDLSDCPLDSSSVSYIVKNLANVSSATLTLSSTSYELYNSDDLSASGWTITP